MAIFYTICATVKGSPKQNQYVYCLMTMYASLKKRNVLHPEDLFILMSDEETAKHIQQNGFLQNAKFVILQKAKSVFDLMKWKYMLPRLVPQLPEGTTITYIDTDILALRSFQTYLPPDYFCVYAEGPANNPNYCGEGNEKVQYDPPAKGYTAGFFSYNLGPNVRATFDRILQDMEENPKPYYTLDQPYFNSHIRKVKTVEYNSNFICMNGHNNLQSATLLNCCGDPGDDAFHFSKQLLFWLALF